MEVEQVTQLNNLICALGAEKVDMMVDSKSGTHFTCFTSTKVQMLTHEELPVRQKIHSVQWNNEMLTFRRFT